LRICHRVEFSADRVGERSDDDDAAQIKNTEIAEELALPPVKIHCSVLAEDAIKAAVEDYRKKLASAE